MPVLTYTHHVAPQPHDDDNANDYDDEDEDGDDNDVDDDDHHNLLLRFYFNCTKVKRLLDSVFFRRGTRIGICLLCLLRFHLL